jgi:hypothetical protein
MPLMKATPVVSALLFAMTCALSGAAVAKAPTESETVPPEVLRAIDAVNQAAQKTGDVINQAAEKTGDALNNAAQQVAKAADQVQQSGNQVDVVENHALAVGLGAIAGVVAFNLATGGMASIPMMASAGGASAVESTVAVSRVYAVSSAVVGGLAGDYAYRRYRSGSIPSVPAEVAQRVTP